MTGMIREARGAGSAIRWRTLQQVGTQGLYFLRMLILARMLAPDAFGLLAIAMASLGVFLRVSDFGMIQALVQARDATPRQHDIAWTVGVLRAFGVAVLLFFMAPLLARAFGEPAATPIIQALALRPCLDGLASIGIARLTRELEFRRLAFIYITATVADLAAAVASAPALGVWALVVGTLTGAVVATLMSYLLAPHRPRLLFQFGEIKPLIRFGRWYLLTGCVALIADALAQVAISRNLGAAALGLYFLALKFTFMPLVLVEAVAGAVALPVFARFRDNREATASFFRDMLALLALLFVPLYALIFMLAPAIELALGSRWAGTVEVIRMMCLPCVIGLFGQLLDPLLLGRGRSDRAFVLGFVESSVFLAALWPLFHTFGLVGVAAALLVGSIAAATIGFIWLGQWFPLQSCFNLAALMASAVAAASAVATVALAGRWLAGLPGLLVAGMAGTVAAVLTYVVLDRIWSLDLLLVARRVLGSR